MNIVGIVGSLRAGSVNAATARAALTQTAAGVDLVLHDVGDLPLYNGDVESVGLPASVVALHDKAASSDGLMFFSPEYNGSFPAVTKNVVDWLSRPPVSWEGKGLSMVVTTPGPRAGESFRSHFDAIMAYQPVKLLASIGIGDYRSKLDDDGAMVDPASLELLAAHLAGFAAVCAAD